MRVRVLGAGVIGLSCAVRLREAGHEVSVWARDLPADTTSAVAAALWYPYRALPVDAVTRWAAQSYAVFRGLAADPATGVRLLPGRELFRTPQPDPWWAAAVPDLTRCSGDGYADGYRFTAPVAAMGTYLRWLTGRLAALGTAVTRRPVSALDEAREGADLVVNATGLGARELVGDRSLLPVRGQVVRVADPGLTEWLLDGEHPDGLTYVVPRGHDVVCGGTDQERSEDLAVDPPAAERILARCRALVPALAAAPVLGHAVGLRPARPAVRLECTGDVVHCYGHGGAGMTLSWGCAAEVAALAG